MVLLQDIYHKMIELSSEARKAYEVMLLNLEQWSSVESEQEVTAGNEPPLNRPSEAAETTSEQPEYCECLSILRPCDQAHHLTCLPPFLPLSFAFSLFPPSATVKIWKKIVTSDSKHTFLNFEEQLSFMHLEGERVENGEDEKS